MATLLRMPGVSADAEEAALVEWTVQPGASLKAGDPIAVVETEKANVDIPVEDDAVLWRTLAEAGESVEVGSPIAVLLSKGEDDSAGEALLASLGLGGGTPAQAAAAPTAAAPEPAPAPAPAPAAAAPAAPAEPAAPAAPAVAGERIFATPLVRRLAQQADVSLEGIRGTGPNGRIVRADLEAHLATQAAGAAAPAPAPAAAPAAEPGAPAGGSTPDSGSYTDVPHTKLRRAIANALVGSKRDAPHFYLQATLRVDDLLALREQINAASETRVSINDLFVKAAARAFREVPDMNVNWLPDAVRRFERIDIAVAIGSDRGLVTPVLRDVDGMSVSEVGRRVRDFVVRADDGKLKQEEIVGGCFTISNLGMYGIEQFSAIINPPQVGILAVGAVVQAPVVVDGRIEVGRTVTVTASFDHRPIDGVLAAKWLAAFKATVEAPLTILV
ncbi:dihydrolipoamide acetyltransferase family protein [Microbacterium aureliae]